LKALRPSVSNKPGLVHSQNPQSPPTQNRCSAALSLVQLIMARLSLKQQPKITIINNLGTIMLYTSTVHAGKSACIPRDSGGAFTIWTRCQIKAEYYGIKWFTQKWYKSFKVRLICTTNQAQIKVWMRIFIIHDESINKTRCDETWRRWKFFVTIPVLF